MKYLLSIALFAFVTQAHSVCRRADPKKVVLMISFHEGSEEERGARQGACDRGETLVVLPKTSALNEVEARRSALNQRLLNAEARSGQCEDEACEAAADREMLQAEMEIEKLDEDPFDFQGQLKAFTDSSRANGVKVSSMIVSGHDGGGEFYGDYGTTDMAKLSQMTKDHPEIFGDTKTLLLMGCWSSTPDQVEQWRVIFPKLRVLGGFVGSAPASTRIAAGTYISGLLRGEKNLPTRATRSSVQAMLNTVQNLNMVTAGVYVNPQCEDPGRSPAYFFVSSANNENELPDTFRPGLNILPTPSEQDTACMRTFGGAGFRGSYDWNALLQYFQGVKEPENNPELRSLYSYLRNNENCFREGLSTPAVSPDQALFLRFFQDVKKNFNKYFKADLETFYKNLDELVAESTDPDLKAKYQEHKKLMGDSLLGMTRKQTLDEISALQGIYDKLFYNPTPLLQSRVDSVTSTFQRMQTHLYRLKGLPPTWHEYVEGEPLAAPSGLDELQEEIMEE